MVVPAEPDNGNEIPMCTCDLLLISSGEPNNEIFHIAVQDSQGEVAEFGSFGIRLTSIPVPVDNVTPPIRRRNPLMRDLQISSNIAANSIPLGPNEAPVAWNTAKRVRLFAKLCAKGQLQPSQSEAFARWWDHTLRLMLQSPLVMSRFSPATYDAATRNCLTFILSFLKLLRIEALDPWLHSRAVFTQTFLVDEWEPCLTANNRKFA